MALVFNGTMIGFAIAFYLFSLGMVSVLGAIACYSIIGIIAVLVQTPLANALRSPRH